MEQQIPKKKKIYKQKFRDVWYERFDWLCRRGNDRVCKVCDVVIHGAGYHLKRHADTELHKKKYRASVQTPSATTYFDENNEKIKLSNLVNEAEFKMTAYLCEHNLPLSLSDLLPDLFVSLFPDSKIASGLKLKRKKATGLVSVLADVACDNLIGQLKNCEFSLIID